jgi:L-ascorbate metabolism protein UlaG (beta-lactamase superfamily)
VITWIGHGTVLIEAGGLRLLTDPVLGRRTGLLRRLVPPPERHAAERIDAVLLSHLHGDHADLPSLRRVGAAVEIIAPSGAAGWLGRRGFTHVSELLPGASTMVGDVPIVGTPAHHDGRRWRRGEDTGAVGFLVEAGRCIYFAGDTDLFPEMATLAGLVDAALLPVAGWGSSVGPGHMDPERAAEAAAVIRPAVAIPIHWGTLGLPWKRPVRGDRAEPALAFAAEVARVAPDVDVRLLAPGDQTELG